MTSTTKKETTAAKTTVEASADGKILNVGAIELTINERKDIPYVPKSGAVIGNIHELETVALGVRENLPVLLIGDTGTGKTSFIRFLANKTNNGFRRLNLNGSTTADELVGHYVVDDKAKGMRWVDGVLLEAMKNGYWLLLDELNAGLPEVLFVLQSVLDDDKFLVVAEHEGEIVHPHADFRVFATMNPSLEYAGTRDLNKALLSRFPIVIQTHYPDAIHEVEIIKSHVPKITDKDVNLMVRVAEDLRKGKKENTISFICSTRELINWAKLVSTVGLVNAATLAILNKCELDTDKKTVEDIFKMLFGRWEGNKLMTLKEIEDQLEGMKKDVKKIETEASAKDKLIRDQQAELESFRKVIGMAAGKLVGTTSAVS
jgi:gas vesicle protein GvpN